MPTLTPYLGWVARATLGKGTSRREARYDLVAAVAKRWGFRLNQRGVSWHTDEAFLDLIRRFPGGGGHTPKRYNLYHLAKGTAHLPGDTAECGVATGITSHLICLATQREGRSHHAFDSFEGLPEPEAIDKPRVANITALEKGQYAVGLDQVRRHLSAFNHVVFHKGWIPDKFGNVADRQFSFVHVDVDFFQPTLDCFKFFYDRMIPGGMIVCDDYGFPQTPGAKDAMDQFFADKPEPIIKLAAGHAMIVKQGPSIEAGRRHLGSL